MISRTVFTVADYIIFAVTIAIALAIGIFFAVRGRKGSTPSSYFLGNRKLSFLPVALSFMVTFESSILLLGYPAEVYVHGMTFIWVNGGLAIGFLLATRITVSVMHPLKITSVFEYFHLRFEDNLVRYFSVLTGIAYYLFYMGLVLYGPALAIESVTDIPLWTTICCFAVASTLYTAIGGIKAVIWTDVFQFIIMIAGMLAFLIVGSQETGGFHRVVALGKQSGRLDIWQFSPDPTIRHTFWCLVVGSFIRYVYISLNQSSVQRINSTASVSQARKVLYTVIPLNVIISSLAMTLGLVAFSYHANKGCDPLATKAIKNLNQIIPYTMMELFKHSPGLPGLFLAAVSSASLSTVSSGLSSLSAITCQDLVLPRFPNLSDFKMTLIAKVAVLLYGFLCTCLAFLMTYIKGPLQQIFVSFMGSIMGPTAGVFLLSIFCRRTTSKGALTGAVVGLAFVLWISLGYNFSASLPRTPWLPHGPLQKCYQNITHNSSTVLSAATGPMNNTSSLPILTTSTTEASPFRGQAEGLDKLYSVSYMYFALIGTLTTLLIGYLASLVTKPQGKVNDLCVLSFRKQFLCCLRKLSREVTRSTNDRKTLPMPQGETEQFLLK